MLCKRQSRCEDLNKEVLFGTELCAHFDELENPAKNVVLSQRKV